MLLIPDKIFSRIDCEPKRRIFHIYRFINRILSLYNIFLFFFFKIKSSEGFLRRLFAEKNEESSKSIEKCIISSITREIFIGFFKLIFYIIFNFLLISH